MVAITPIKRPWNRVAVGEVFEMAPQYAKVLVRLGRAAYVKKKPATEPTPQPTRQSAPAPEPEPETEVEAEVKPKPKRVYRRRDMQAEE
jgi:hypothetical protein